MWRGFAVPTILMGVSLLVGCATPYAEGRSALREGRYGVAASRFQDVFSRDPHRFDALVGLGIARYKEGKFDEAVDELNRAIAGRPDDQTARVYLALGYFRKGDDKATEDHLAKLSELKPPPRLAAQIERTLGLMRQHSPLTDELRAFIAGSLEAEADRARDSEEAMARAGALLGTCCNIFGFDVGRPVSPRMR